MVEKTKVKAVMVRITEDEFPQAVAKIKELNKDLKLKNDDGSLNSRDVRQLLGLRATKDKTGFKSQILAKVKDLPEDKQKELLEQLNA